MRQAQCSVLAGETTVHFSHASSLWTNYALWPHTLSVVWDMYV